MKRIAAQSWCVSFRVAPHAGAWIETIPPTTFVKQMNVAPHAGAWIETPFCPRRGRSRPSPPTRGRGLKPNPGSPEAVALGSPPTRGRGLKLREA